MHAYKTMLESFGIPDTGSEQIAEALFSLHTAISNLDDNNRVLLGGICPEAISAAEDYASFEDLNDDVRGCLDPCIVFTPDFNVDPPTKDNVTKLEDYR